MKKKILIGLGIAVVAVAGFLFYQSSQATAEDEGTPVELYEAKKQEPLRLKGQVQSLKKQSVFVDEEKGPVRTIHVAEGQHVTKGTPLITYRWGEIVRAEHDSIVTSLDEDAKNDPQKPIMVLKSVEQTIKGTVTEYDRSKINLEQPVDIQYTSNGQIVQGRVTNISEVNNEPDEDSQDGIVTYNYTAVSDQPVPVGYSVEILIPRDEIRLPEQSVSEEDGAHYVYTVNKGKAEKRKIIAEKVNGYYIMREGLQENEKIIKDIQGIRDGMDVTAE
ncbi:efflux RND transporter periplasmic adaptor subunit [Candidatus Enterococcus ferrettii]|uniref:HlyD family secretion protein n=1 Tax=Candidatus Enterococcus ferrettii TaxID=2815324 RepID=A0ABV0EXE0_9ENTE|nr:efflux RND transporter periplasmic adaptor subunit [Enterococcus sp. 665A]MBO1340630.1 efflux RND transporter periplasmic adaptor subunit [Enterococcus sp. 665A]